MDYFTTTMSNLIQQTAFLNLTIGNVIMIVVALIFLYLAIGKGFEPLLLLPISFGMLLVNIYPDIMLSIEDSPSGVGGLLHYFYKLDGSEYNYFNLDEFMKHYGLLDISEEKYLCNRDYYGNEDIKVYFDLKDADIKSPTGSGHVVIDKIDVYYQDKDNTPTGSIGSYHGLKLDGIDVYEINGITLNGKCHSTYCLSFEQIVLLGVTLDCYQKEGNTVAACKSICEVFEDGGGGGGGVGIRLR